MNSDEKVKVQPVRLNLYFFKKHHTTKGDCKKCYYSAKKCKNIKWCCEYAQIEMLILHKKHENISKMLTYKHKNVSIVT